VIGSELVRSYDKRLALGLDVGEPVVFSDGEAEDAA
jgi:hypothetical protein